MLQRRLLPAANEQKLSHGRGRKHSLMACSSGVVTSLAVSEGTFGRGTAELQAADKIRIPNKLDVL